MVAILAADNLGPPRGINRPSPEDLLIRLLIESAKKEICAKVVNDIGPPFTGEP